MNLSASEEIDFLTAFSPYIRTYVYATTGLLLSATNLPIFLTIVTDKSFRTYYFILAFVFVHGGITGLLTLSYSVYIFFKSSLQHELISNKKCIFQISTALLQLKLLNTFGLLANSIDRLLFVAFPIYYFRSIRKLNVILLIGLYMISFISIFTGIIVTLLNPTRMIQSNCPHQSTFDPKALHALQIFGSLSATMSIVMMMCVVYCIRRRYDTILKRTNNVKRDLQNFMKKQKRFTLTTFMSCIVTLFLHVIPSFVLLLCTDMQRQSCVSFGLFSNLLSYLNSLNMPLLFFYRQDDVRKKMLDFMFSRLLSRTPVQAVSTNFNT